MSIYQMFCKKRRQNKNRRGQRALRLETLETRELMATFMLTDDWADAEKSPINSDDDALCWAAAAANVLEWTGWGKVDGMDNADQMFQHFQDHWEDGGNEVRDAWSWWFDGVDPDAANPNATNVDVPGGGGFWPSKTFSDYYHRDGNPVTMIRSLANYLHEGYGTVLSIMNDGGGDHFVTCWGYETGPFHADDYIGLYVTDSDDDKNLVAPPDVLDARDLVYDWTDNRWYIGDRSYGFNVGEFKVEGTQFIAHDGSRVDIGELKGGIAADDGATGQGFIMYSEESVHDRFDGTGAEPHRANSDHLIAVKYDGGQWYYDNNSGLHPFTPRSTDRLLAQVDFDLDTIASLEGQTGTEFGIAKGFASGDLEFYANRFGGDWYIASVRGLEQITNDIVSMRVYDPPELPLPPYYERRDYKVIAPEFEKVEYYDDSLTKDVATPLAVTEEQLRSKTDDSGESESSSDQKTSSETDKTNNEELDALTEEWGKVVSI